MNKQTHPHEDSWLMIVEWFRPVDADSSESEIKIDLSEDKRGEVDSM